MLTIFLLTFKFHSPSVPRAGFGGLNQWATLPSGFLLVSANGALCDGGLFDGRLCRSEHERKRWRCLCTWLLPYHGLAAYSHLRPCSDSPLSSPLQTQLNPFDQESILFPALASPRCFTILRKSCSHLLNNSFICPWPNLNVTSIPCQDWTIHSPFKNGRFSIEVRISTSIF